MNAQNPMDSVKKFFSRIGKRNLAIAGVVVLIGAAVLINWAVLSTSGNGDDGFSYDASAGMDTEYGTTMGTTSVGEEETTKTGADTDETDRYFSTVETSRQRARDEALEVLNAVVENDKATEEVKAEALAEIQTIAKEMAQEANIESLLLGKGFTQCIAVINGESANIVVRQSEDLQSAQLAQINAVVYEQAGIEPINITIVHKK